MRWTIFKVRSSKFWHSHIWSGNTWSIKVSVIKCCFVNAWIVSSFRNSLYVLPNALRFLVNLTISSVQLKTTCNFTLFTVFWLELPYTVQYNCSNCKTWSLYVFHLVNIWSTSNEIRWILDDKSLIFASCPITVSSVVTLLSIKSRVNCKPVFLIIYITNAGGIEVNQ